MTDKEYLNTALANMHYGQWFGWTKQDDNGNKIPNDQECLMKILSYMIVQLQNYREEVEAKIQELKNIEVINKQNKQSAINKLKALGLTDAEVEAFRK
jgi:hypothetical protein